MSKDEKLSGYLDSELDAPERAEMAATLKRDGDTRNKIARMRQTDDLVRSAHEQPMGETVPDRFLRVIDERLARARTVEISVPVAQAANDNKRAWWLTGGAMAASLMLGVLLGAQILSRGAGGSAAMTVALAEALETSPSGTSLTLKSGEAITPQLTFARSGGGHCRQFALAQEATRRTGLACRNDGRWSLEVLLPSAPGRSIQDGYLAAEGSGDTTLNATVEALRAGDPLDKVEEDALIARRWRYTKSR